jgi:hypothetical protein
VRTPSWVPMLPRRALAYTELVQLSSNAASFRYGCMALTGPCIIIGARNHLKWRETSTKHVKASRFF